MDAGHLAHHCASQSLKSLLEETEMRVFRHTSIANYDIGLSRHDGFHQRPDVACIILIVSVRINDDVGTMR